MTEENKSVKKFPNLRFPGFEGDWQVKKLGELANIYDGTHQTPTYTNKGVKFVSVENINDIENTNKFITPEAFQKEYKIKPQKGDILMTRITAGIIGATAIVKNNEPLGYYVSLALIRIKVDLDIDFLAQRIETNQFKNQLHKRIIHVAFPKKINLGDIQECTSYFPLPAEQEKISFLIVLINERITSSKKIIEKLESLMLGSCEKIFSQKFRFKDDLGNDFPDWEKSKLENICQKQSSNISANKIENNFGNYIVYGASGVLKKVDFYEEENDYISIVKDGAGVGRLFFCKGKSSVLGTMEIIKTKLDVNLQFLFYQLGNIDFKKYITGSTIPHIYFKDYKKENVKIPSLEEQNKIANFLSSIQEKILTEKQILEKLELQKKFLLANLFV